jgi:hypothetical protein
VRNNRRLAKLLLARICARPAMIVDLYDAMAFIDMHGDRTRLWVAAETAIRSADHNSRFTWPPRLSKTHCTGKACLTSIPFLAGRTKTGEVMEPREPPKLPPRGSLVC